MANIGKNAKGKGRMWKCENVKIACTEPAEGCKWPALSLSKGADVQMLKRLVQGLVAPDGVDVEMACPELVEGCKCADEKPFAIYPASDKGILLPVRCGRMTR
jgi:hypothetical protein